MSYQEQLKRAQKKGKLEPLTVNIHSWDKPGEKLLGKVLKVVDFKGGKFESECKKYIIDTDVGMVTTILGASVDKQFEGVSVVGKIIWIEYKGQVTLKNGRPCNQFDIMEVSSAS